MEYVYSVNDGNVTWGPTGSTVKMRPDDVWRADDPFVTSRPDLFSATPLRVHSTQGIQSPPATPIVRPAESDPELEVAAPRRGRRAS
jgi:hypothetical protein